MASVNDRVRVTDQSNHARNQLGTVVRVEGGFNYVRLDGQGINQETRLKPAQLGATSLPSPIDYP